MPRTAQALLDLLEPVAREADRGSRIELRDPIAAFGTAAISEIRSWLGDPEMVSLRYPGSREGASGRL